MVPGLLADLDLPAGAENWWIYFAGGLATLLVFLLGMRLLRSEPRPAPAGELPAEPDSDPFVEGSRDERRLAMRRKGSSITVHITDFDLKGRPAEGWVLDRSVGGIGLWSPKPVGVGTLLKVRPEHAPAMTPWVDVEVRSCQPLEGGWHINAAFVKTPPYSVLLLFG